MPPKTGVRRKSTRRVKKRDEEEQEPSDNEIEQLGPTTLARPFQTIEGLPLSTQEPDYGLLTNPLSIKDSAVLYSSLMKSRKAYVKGNIFDLYWAKGKTKFENDINARDRMNKMSDCSLIIGPHSFDVRFYILKDEEIEKRRVDEKTEKKANRLAARQEREEKKKFKALEREKKKAEKAKLEVEKAKMTVPTEGDKSSEQPATKEGETDKGKADDKPKDTTEENDNTDEDDDSDDSESSDSDSDTDSEDEDDKETENDDGKVEESKVDESKDGEKDTEKSKTEEKTIDQKKASSKQAKETKKKTSDNEAKKDEKSEPNDTNDSKTEGTIKPTETKSTNSPKKDQSSIQPKSVPDLQKRIPLPPLKAPSKSITTSNAAPTTSPAAPTKSTITPAPPTTRPTPPTANDLMQSPESQIMIANLNAIARAEPSLNILMKIVATGNAKPEQIREFQGYIQRAKSMGPPPQFLKQNQITQTPSSKSNSPANTANNATTTTTTKKQQKTPRPPKEPKPPKAPKPPREPKQPKTPKEKKVKVKKLKTPKVPKDQHLTSFQEKYVNGSDLVFEFTECLNIRYFLPKYCVYEKLENGDTLVSMLVIHNADEIKKWETKKEKAELKEKELVEKKEQEDKDKAATTTAPNETPKGEEDLDKMEDESKESTAKPEDNDAKMEDSQPEVPVMKEEKVMEIKPLEEDEPVPYYSALTFTISNLPFRFDRILQNSFHKLPKVQAHMKRVMKYGVRVPKHHLWYSVDGVEDEELAENLRNDLYLIENPPKGKYKKRSASIVAAGASVSNSEGISEDASIKRVKIEAK